MAPLEVQPGSQFPKRLLYLLAPSYRVVEDPKFWPWGLGLEAPLPGQIRSQTQPISRCIQTADSRSFFEDMALMSAHSTQAYVEVTALLCECLFGELWQNR